MAGSERELQLLREARSLVSDEGVQALTMRRLGRRSQIAAAGIYHYFRSRDDLVDHLHDVVFAEYEHVLGPAPTDPSAEAVASWLSNGQSWLAANGELVALTAECGLRHQMAHLPAHFVQVLVGGTEPNPSEAAAAVKPDLVGDAAILLMRTAALPSGSVDLPRMVKNFRSHVQAIASVS